jgi:type IX secretion system PorP/SprF family membrane protein
MKTKILTQLILLFICSVPFGLKAQQDPMVSQYMFSGHFLNPAYAGSHPYANITLLGRKQWVGFNGSPFTSFLSFDKPFQKKKIAIGAIVSNDRIGVTNRTIVTGSLAYHLHLSANARLSGGISAGIQSYSAELSKLIIWDESDQVFASNINGKVLPVAGLGLYYYTRRFYAGVSVPNVISYKPETFLDIGINRSAYLQRHYFATTGYAFPAGKNLDIRPSILVKYTANAPVSIDYNLHFLFYKSLWLGASYRQKDGGVAMVEYQATKNLRVGYAFDMAFSNMRRYNSGSHEIMLAWDFVKDDQTRYTSPRFF